MRLPSEKKERRYTDSENEKARHTYIRISMIQIALLILLLLASYPKRIAASESDQNHSPIQKILSAYGYADEQSIQVMDAHFKTMKPEYIDSEGIDICIQEVLYDGVWAYSTVYVHPQRGQSITIVPGGADPMDETTTGSEGEILSFLDVARQNGNRLLAVYCYPQEFDSQGTYFMDYVETTDEAFYLISGCNIPLRKDSIPLSMMLEIYEIDPDTLHYQLVAQKKLRSKTYSPFFRMEKYDYHTEEDSNLFETVTLLKTGITSYLYINWRNSDDAGIRNIIPLTENMEMIPSGYSLDAHAVYLTEIPEVINIRISDEDDKTLRVRLMETSS